MSLTKTTIFWILRTLTYAPIAILSSCGPDDPEPVGTQTPPSTLLEGQSSDLNIVAATESDPHLMDLDPLKDGWDSEHLSSLAGEQLNKLAEVFESSGFSDQSKLPKIFTDEVNCNSLRPLDLKNVLPDKDTTVLRPSSFPITASKVSLADCFSALTSSAPTDGERYAKFKIIGITPIEQGFQSTQLVSLNIRNGTSAWEQNATWNIAWKNNGSESPLINSLELKEFEEIHSATKGVWFSDQTASVFSKETEISIATGQFGIGVGEWTERLTDYLLVRQYGHNGLAVGDVNGDGFEDLYRCQTGGLPNRLFLGTPDGTLRDYSKEAGLDFLDNCLGALFIDLDNDEDQDLVLAMPLQVVFFKNDGSGKFEIATRIDQQNVYSLAAADFDHDGDLDVYTCVYYADEEIRAELPIPMPIYDAKNGGQNALLENDGNWKFTNITKAAGLAVDNSRFSFAAIWEDYNNDGDLDLYVVNDFGHNNLYQNKGGHFQHITEQSGTRNGTFGMSASSADFNHDGWMDLYKASMFSSAGNRVVTQERFLPTASPAIKNAMFQMAQGNTLFTNTGQGSFRDDGIAAGVSMGRWSWGSIFMDFNNDSWEDLFVTNGFVTGRNPNDL